jgi:hypothetical protein
VLGVAPARWPPGEYRGERVGGRAYSVGGGVSGDPEVG